MTPSTVYQPLNNIALTTQQGDGIVASVEVELLASDALISLSASAWSAASGEMSIELWMDGQPTGGRLAMYANTPEMHLSLGRTYVWLQDVEPGTHTLELMAGPTTVTDSNDIACVTIWQMGDGCAVRFADDAPCPTGVSQTLIKEAVGTKGGQLLISSSTSGWAAQAGNMIQGFIVVDGGDGAGMEVFPNNAAQHLATVPADLVYQSGSRGEHLVQVNAGGLTSTDGGDTAHLAVVEWVDPANAPTVLPLTPPLQNATANSQSGDGGTIAAANFTCSGGTLLIRVSLSCWTNQEPGLPLYCGIQIDGTSHGFTQIWANYETTHMPMVPNDLVLNNIPAGMHTLGLLAESGVITDVNDRVSALVMEFPPVS